MFDIFCFSVELGVLLDGCPVFANLFVFGATRAAPQSFGSSSAFLHLGDF